MHRIANPQNNPISEAEGSWGESPLAGKFERCLGGRSRIRDMYHTYRIPLPFVPETCFWGFSTFLSAQKVGLSAYQRIAKSQLRAFLWSSLIITTFGFATALCPGPQMPSGAVGVCLVSFVHKLPPPPPPLAGFYRFYSHFSVLKARGSPPADFSGCAMCDFAGQTYTGLSIPDMVYN